MDNFDINNFNNYQILNNSYWIKYNNLIQHMSQEQKIFVSKQESVLEAKQNLMSSFLDYLFEREKSNFINSSDEAKRISDIYIESIKIAADKYVTRNEELEKENAELKHKIQQLLLDFEGKGNGKDKITTK